MRLAVPWLLAGRVAVSVLIVVLVKPHASAIAGDGYRWPYYLSIFAGGYLAGARHQEVLSGVARHAYWPQTAATLVFLVKVGILWSANSQ